MVRPRIDPGRFRQIVFRGHSNLSYITSAAWQRTVRRNIRQGPSSGTMQASSPTKSFSVRSKDFMALCGKQCSLLQDGGKSKANSRTPRHVLRPPAARGLAALHFSLIHQYLPQNPKARYKPKNLYRTFILCYWYKMIKVSSVPSFQRRNKQNPRKPIKCAPEWHRPWQCSQPWCSRRPSCRRCAGRHPARRSRRFQWHQPQLPCQSCNAASWRRKGCRQWG